MATKDEIIAGLDGLPIAKQVLVKQYIDKLASETRSGGKSILGLCRESSTGVTEDDISEARNEMWSGFPREIEQ